MKSRTQKALRLKSLERLRPSFVLLILFTLLFPPVGNAWNDKTHMVIAYIAYRNLNRDARDRVDEIMVLHPLYKEWTHGAKLGQAGMLAFVHAATWPDCIQDSTKCPGYIADGTDDGMIPAVSQESWQNVGYSDKFMHKYWHFIREPYATDNRPVQEPQKPNIETQLQLLIDAINSNEDDTLKSYDLTWVENLVGEIHQPLNCISRFSARHPAGDQNGRDVKLCKAPCSENLHDYWDNLLGTQDDFESVIKETKSLGSMDQGDWSYPVDVPEWIKESIELAKNVVYTPAVMSEDSSGNPVEPNDEYRKAAVNTARRQILLAAHRLAGLLNSNLK